VVCLSGTWWRKWCNSSDGGHYTVQSRL